MLGKAGREEGVCLDKEPALPGQPCRPRADPPSREGLDGQWEGHVGIWEVFGVG